MSTTKILSLYILSIAFFHSALFFAPSIQIEGNYEFAKILISQMILGCILPFLIYKKRITYNSIAIIFACLIIVSTIFSPSPFISFFGDTSRGQGAVFYLEMIFLFFIFLHLEKNQIKKIISYILIGSFFIGIWAIKEYFLPSFDYGMLQNRAIGTFGHPSFLTSFFLLLTPFIFDKVFNHKNYKYSPLVFLVGIVLLLSQHYYSIIIFCIFILYFFLPKIRNFFSKKIFFYGFFIIGATITILTCFNFLLAHPEKLHSGLSRIYIWKSVGEIIFSLPKIFFIGNGPETLGYFFTSFKDPHLYIFENFGYTADRAHNIFLDAWYNFGILAFLGYLGIFGYLLKNFKKNPYYESVLIFFIFNYINFPSVTSIILFLLFLAKIFKDSSYNFQTHKKSILVFFGPVFFILGIIAGIIYSAEHQYYEKNIETAKTTFPYPKYFLESGDFENALKIEKIQDSKYLKTKIYYTKSKISDCAKLIKNYPSIENYFFCGKIFRQLGDTNRAKFYYSKGVEKLPDLWNKNSPYWQEYFVKTTITGNRFFSEKFSSITSVLEFLNIEKTKE